MSAAATGSPVLVLGSGPAACIAAISHARLGMPVTLAARPPDTSGGQRLDAVPLQMLAALIEIGVHPETLAIGTCHDLTLRSWGTDRPTASPTAPKVHLDRTRLDRTLFELAARTSGVIVEPGSAASPAHPIIDATGRRASTANRVERPDPEWVARIRHFSGTFSAAQAAFRIASLPYGYVYRLGTAKQLCLGFVTPSDYADRLAADWRGELERWRASWIVEDGIATRNDGLPGRGGACSVQWAEPGSAILLGDAAFAPDILAAQGLSSALTKGLAITGKFRGDGLDPLVSHLAALRRAIAECQWYRRQVWRRYDAYLARMQRQLSGARGESASAALSVVPRRLVSPTTIRALSTR